MAEVKIQATPRSESGKGAARKLRASGRVPGILYGRGIEPVALAVDARTLNQALHTDAGRNVLIDLSVDGAQHLALIRELQRDIVRGDLKHVDFLKIAADVAIEVEVPIHITGESAGVKEGGVIEHHLWNVRVSCLPHEVPERLDADVSHLDIGDALRVEALVAPAGVTILTEPEEIIVTCVVPQKPEEEVPAAAEALAEGEVPEGAEGEAPAAEGAETPGEES